MTIDKTPLWVLGYGSLIFKPPPHAKYCIPGLIHGFVRRFWQSSSDHRGTPEKKGRVATLIPFDDILIDERFEQDVWKYDSSLKNRKFTKEDLKVAACVYYIPAEFAQEVTDYLNVREQDGYTIHQVPIHLNGVEQSENEDLLDAIRSLDVDPKTGKRILTSTVYIGTVDNESFVGPEDIADTAKIISETSGSSGENWEYLESLHKSLLKLEKNHRDEYLDALVEKVLELKA